MTTTLLALGGGGFTARRDDEALDAYALSLARAGVPRICLLPTASGDQAAQVTAFYEAFGARTCEPTHVSLFRLGAQPIDLRAHLLAQDVIYAGGGSLRNLLAIWRAHGLDDVLIEAWRRGTVLAGVSAGAMCWFAGGVTTSSGVPEPARGLGLVPGSLSVHLDAEPDRRPVYVDAVRRGALPPGWAVDDGAGLLFCDGGLARVVTARRGAAAIRVEADGAVRRLDAELLGSRRTATRRTPSDVLELRALHAFRALRAVPRDS